MLPRERHRSLRGLLRCRPFAPQHILLIEPVKPDSNVARLIAESKKK